MKGSGSYGSPPSHHYSSSSHHGSQGDDAHRGQGSQAGQHGGHHWGEHPQSNQSKSQSLMPPSQNFNSDNERSDPYSDVEDYLDDEDEIYLRPGEPYGAWLQPVDDPYIRSVKIEEANRELFNGPSRLRKSNIKVRFWEDRNEYYDLEDNNYDSPPQDYEVVSEGSFSLGGRQRSERTPQSPPHGDPPQPRRQSPRGSPPK